jgi:hypothetical protein
MAAVAEGEVVYHGERKCEALLKSGDRKGQRCPNGAYFRDGDGLFCKKHSSPTTREALPKMTARMKAERARERRAEHAATVREAAAENRGAGRKGQMILTKKPFMGSNALVPGYVQVYPNFKDAGKTSAEGNILGAATLSPKRLGPVDHEMPNLPPAKNIENYHQIAKIFPYDLDAAGKVTEWSVGVRKRAYLDPVPYRHKKDYPAIVARIGKGGKTAPLYSLFYTTAGEPREFTYIECRAFYCVWFERLAREEAEFRQLRELLDNGHNLEIVGYDAHPPADNLFDTYLDPDLPFGHELVLYAMLTIDDPANFPWNVYIREHSDRYEGFPDITGGVPESNRPAAVAVIPRPVDPLNDAEVEAILSDLG